jgi:type II secretory pathway pseudopilin PulG
MRARPTAFIRRSRRAFSLVEISLVIAVMLGLMVVVGISVVQVQNWRRAKQASLAAQAVHEAQRAYLADHPTTVVEPVGAEGDVQFVLEKMGAGGEAMTAASFGETLEGYLPQGWAGMPAAQGLKDEALTLDFLQVPPRWRLSGALYDPSGSDRDGLWDAGE